MADRFYGENRRRGEELGCHRFLIRSGPETRQHLLENSAGLRWPSPESARCLAPPPLDFELFKGLRKYLSRNRATLAEARLAFITAQKGNARWTKFSKEDYLAHIDAIKLLMAGRPLYQVEEHWEL